MNILDDAKRLYHRDSEHTLETALTQADQATIDLEIINRSNPTTINRIVVSGMGGSALAALLAKAWLGRATKIPFEVVRTYELPDYVDESTLIIASSCSGNTEETLATYDDAQQKQAQLYVITKGGALLAKAQEDSVPHIILPNMPVQPRMLTITQLKAIATILQAAGLVDDATLDELRTACTWLARELKQWSVDVPYAENTAKQLAQNAAGKTAVFFSGPLMSAVAYKWKISWNENAKNTSFWNEYPEFNHNEFMGWSSHPVEKPFAIFDIMSSLENPRIHERMVLSDQLLSGKRPKATKIEAKGDTLLQQLLWTSAFADFSSIYLGIINNVDPGPVPLIEKFKKELGQYSVSTGTDEATR